MVGAEYEYLFANAAYAEVLGLPAGEIVGRRVPDLLPAVWAQIRPRLDRALAGERQTYDLTQPSNGAIERRHYRVMYEPRTDAGGQTTVVVVVVDVTDHRQAEADLRAERDRLEKVVETAPAVILSFRLRPDGTACFPFASPRVQDLYGVTPEDIKEDATPVFNIVHPDDRGDFQAAIAESARTMSHWRCEFRVIHQTRGEVWVEGNAAPLRDPDGGITWHGALSDVTDRRRTELALRESETQLAAAQTMARLGSWKWEPSTDRVWWSDALFELYGVRRGEVTPSFRSFLEQLHPDDRLRATRRVDDVLAGAAGFADDLRVVRPDGEVRWIHSRASAYRDATGRIISVEGTDQDITEQRRTEEVLRESQAKHRRGEALLSAVLDALPVSVIIADESGRLVRMNPCEAPRSGDRPR
ncbi:MAG: PAS domain-containing protein [Gemmataceae bacterium]